MITAKDSLAADLAKLTPARLKSASFKELTELAGKIRQFLIDSIAATGGHIGANLATIELSLALHRVFESPEEKIIWDTGHQGYTHKIVTGRADRFYTLNTPDGMSRFVSKRESEHDVIDASHGGTAISVALGVALAKALRGDPRFVVAVIGDGALAEGMALEALNHAAVAPHTNLILVLNDNGYAISPGVGALHNYLQTLRPGTRDPEHLFTALGLDYVGPVNGHDIEATVAALERARVSTQIPLVHLKTVKGYGWRPADGDPYRMHFSFPFDPNTGRARGVSSAGYPDVAAQVIGAEMDRDERIVVITPAAIHAAGLQPIFEKFPDRSFDPGMEEQHAITMTVGFALERMKPVVVLQSTFLQRAFDQLVHDVCFGNVPALILSVRSGFAGYDSPARHGIYDFAYWRGLPNLRVLYPKDRFEVERMVRDALRDLDAPTIIAMPYGPVDEIDRRVLNDPPAAFARPEIALEGHDLMIVAVGHKYRAAHTAAERLRKKGVDCGVINLRYVKPLPEDVLVALLANVPRVVTLEEGVLDGGVGSAIATLLSDRRVKCDVLRIGLPCTFVEAGSSDELCRAYGLDADGVLARIRETWMFDA